MQFSGRHITTNIFTAQEIIYLMHGKSSKKVWMAIKVDLEKANVRLSYIGNFAACISNVALITFTMDALLRHQ